MCGIVGYIGYRNAVPILLQGLKRVDYRGYDSCGLAIIDNKKEKIRVKKVIGRIEKLKKNVRWLKNSDSTIGIAHTRWATHGRVTEKNAHPHFSCDGKIAVVHNGIIENYSELKILLEREGHKFSSETDTEIMAHLIEKFLLKGFDIEESFIRALKLIEGAYAFAMIYLPEKKIFVAKRGSPIVLGIGKKEMFIASDVSVILPNTKKCIFMKDNELAILSINRICVKNLDKLEIIPEIVDLKLKADEISRKGFPNFMLKEIFEQPLTISRALKGRINKIKKFDLKLNLSRKEIKKIKKIIFIGCGTSWHAGVFGKYLFEDIAGIPCQAEYASEFRYNNSLKSYSNRDDMLAIVLSQSGETADTLAALRELKKYGVKTIGLINAVGSTISREVDSGFYLHSGIEVGVASTKTFTSHLVILILLSLYFALSRRTIEKKKVDKILREIKKIPVKIEEILKQDNKIREIAIKYFKNDNALYLGRGYNYPIALEGALKLKEISYVHAEGYPAAEMKHGPIALIDKNMPSIFIAPKDRLYGKILSNIKEIKCRHGKVIAITTKDNKKILNEVDEAIFIPKTIEPLMPLLTVIPTQLLAYHIAIMRGCDVDKPRNLAKSVTVE